MHVRRLLLVLSIVFSANIVSEAQAQSRRDLKRFCKAEFKSCVASGEKKKSCRKAKRNCRKEHGVRFIDDIKNIGKKIGKVAKKVVGQVSVKRIEIGEEEIFLVNVKSKHLARTPEIAIQPLAPKKSSIGIVANEEGGKDVALQIYSSDFDDEHVLQPLQTSPGRPFPRFIGGAQYQQLQGKQVGKVQVYLDQEVQVFGAFVPLKLAGGVIGTVNGIIDTVLSKVPVVGGFIPNINSIPVGVKVKGIKVGRLSVLSHDSQGKNSGLVLLVDKQELAYAAKL